jgi:hypothetical protein
LALATVAAQNASGRRPPVSGGRVATWDIRRCFLSARLKIAISQQPEIKALRALLLRIGGTELVAPPWHDCHVAALICGGFVMDGHVVLRTMRPCSCHRNTSRLWSRNGNMNRKNGLIGIGTGYALSGDGLWRQHSWGVGKRGIVETTEARVTYFGRLLRGEDADLFAACNSD